MQRVAGVTVYGGTHVSEDWGDLPFVIMFGGDKQLPSFGRGATFLPIGAREDNGTPPANKNVQLGEQQFLNFSNNVMKLEKIKRQDETEHTFTTLLHHAHYDQCEPSDVEHMKDRHLVHGKLTQEQIDWFENEALFVYANKEPKRIHNIMRLHLQKIHISSNPVARIVPSSTSFSKHGKAINNHFNTGCSSGSAVTICMGAKVTIIGRNFKPKWGLFNGAIRTVIEINYNHDKNPNCGDHPNFVVVNFPQYQGPVYEKANPSVSSHHSNCILQKLMQFT